MTPFDLTLRERFLDLLQRHISRLTIRGNRASGLCPFHPDRHPSFFADLERGVWFCFPCNRGGGVRAFAEEVGEASNRTHRETRSAKAHRVALTAARDAYETWQRQRLAELASEYRELAAEREAVEAAYRLLYRRPDLCTDEEASRWIAKLAKIYDRLAPLEWDLDTLTYHEHERVRFLWWRGEVKSGRVSA